MKFSHSCDDICYSFDLVDLTIHNHGQETLPNDQLDSFLFEPIKDCQPSKDINFCEDEIEIAIDKEKLGNSLDSSTTPMLFSDLEDLKPEYAFRDGNQEFPISTRNKSTLVDVNYLIKIVLNPIS
ncbi:hypothetical protein Tco_1171735 [Tanacetum coccineum]